MRTLVNVSPSADFRAMEEMFDRVFGLSGRANVPSVTTLPIDITEHDGKLFVRAAVPGVEPNELDVQVEKNVLTIRGETKAESMGEDEKVYRREVSYGAFSRSIRLPEGLDIETAEADFKNGVVTIAIQRLPEEKPKTLKVNVRPIEAPAPSSEG